MHKKVIFFLDPNVGGAQRVSVLLAKMLDKALFDVEFVIVGESSLGIKDFLPHDAHVSSIPVKGLFIFHLLKIASLLQKNKPDIVFSSQMYLSIRIIIASIIVGGIKIIIRSNSMMKNLRKNPCLFVFAKTLYKRADIVIAQTEEMKDELRFEFGINDSRIVVLNNPIDIESIEEKVNHASPYKDSSIRFVMVGRVLPVKGYEYAINAFAEVLKVLHTAHLFIVGDYSINVEYYRRLQLLIDEKKLSSNVHFVGHTDNPYIWIKNANSLVLASKVEGLPNALVEASYLRIPCVSTNCASIVNRIISEGENGYIVNYGDISDMSKKMMMALNLKKTLPIYVGATAEDVNRLFSFI